MFSGLFQDAICRTKDIIDETFGVVNGSSTIVACSDIKRVGTKVSKLSDAFFFEASGFKKESLIYFPFERNSNDFYAVFVNGTSSSSKKYAKLLAILFENISKQEDKSKIEEEFIKNLLLDNVLPSEIEYKASELSINKDTTRVCLVVRIPKELSFEIFNFVKSLFPNVSRDFVVISGTTDIAVIKEISNTIYRSDLQKLSRSLLDAISSEFSTNCSIGIGKNVDNIRKISKSFKEAKISLEVGKIFDSENSIACYEQLGAARLIHRLPEDLCKVFLDEIFNDKVLGFFDKETLFTIQKFFENNLNISETSRSLFIHRNTLVYRLSKIKKITGLDVRNFDDAATFKIALMVKKYLSYQETNLEVL